MPVNVKEFVQTQWLTAGINRYAKNGDFSNLSALAPNHTKRRLKRGPDWSALKEHTGLVNIEGMFYDKDNERYVIIGKASGSSTIQSGYFDSSWTFNGPYTLLSGYTSLGGYSMQNIAYYGGYLYLIESTYEYVFRSSGYTSGMGLAWWDYSTDARILVPFGARMYMLTSKGVVWRLNDTATAFESYLDPAEDFEPVYATPFKGYLLVVALHTDGRFSLYRVNIPTATYFHELATIYNARVNMPDAGLMFAVHEDTFYFSPGPQDGTGEHTLEVFAYDGTVLRKFCEFTVDVAVGTGTAGFLNWQNKLIYYVMTGSTARFYALTGDNFTSYAPATMTFGSLSINPIAKGLNDAILVTAHNATPTQGIYYATLDTLQDGYVETARMDFDHPGRQKRLERLTVITDAAAADFDVIIKYRTDDNASWTTAKTQDSTQIVSVGSLGVDFYTLQVRIELDDDTGNNEDIAIEALSVIYTQPE
jgi:hypothetical protein